MCNHACSTKQIRLGREYGFLCSRHPRVSWAGDERTDHYLPCGFTEESGLTVRSERTAILCLGGLVLFPDDRDAELGSILFPVLSVELQKNRPQPLRVLPIPDGSGNGTESSVRQELRDPCAQTRRGSRQGSLR